MREWSIIIPFWMTPCRERTRTYYHEHILHSLHSHTYSIRDQTTQRVNIELTLERRWRHTTRFRLIIRFGFVEEIMWWITLFVHVHQRGNYMSVLSIPLSGSGCCYVEGLLRKACNHQIIGSVTHRPVSGIISATHTSSIHPCNDWSYAIDCKCGGPQVCGRNHAGHCLVSHRANVQFVSREKRMVCACGFELLRYLYEAHSVTNY